MGKTRGKNSRYTSSKETSRKPIRPLERQRMRPWLIDQLDRGDVSQLNWLNKREKTFRISWRHAARQGWDADVDASLFERWARHTGKYYDGDEPDAKKWKANFRCALNSLPDVEEVKDLGIKKGQNAFKVYRFLDERRIKPKRSKASVSDEEDDTFEILQTVSRARRYQKALELDLDSEGSETCLSPKREPIDHSDHDSSTDMETNQEDHAYPSSLPLFDKFCNFGSALVQPKVEAIDRLPEASSPPYPCSSSDDESKSTTSSVPTDEEVVEMLLDEPEYSPFLWGTPLDEVDEEQIVEESIVDPLTESQSTYIVLAPTLGSPNVVVQQTENLTDSWTLTGLEL